MSEAIDPTKVAMKIGRFLYGPANPNWKGDAARRHTKRERVRRHVPLGKCERCGRPATERHHKDNDTGNNAPDNIEVLCRRCHMIADGRMSTFVAAAGGRKTGREPPKPCVNCGVPSKPLRRGRCDTCNTYLRRRGVERPPRLFAGKGGGSDAQHV